MDYTLLKITQLILSSMDSDDVNNIDDTIESQQVVDVIEMTYYDIVDDFDISGRENLFQLTASGTTARPTHMTLPSNIRELYWVKYDTRTSASADPTFEAIRYLEPIEFHTRVMLRNSSDSNIDTVTDPSGVPLYIRNDVAPSYWTSFEDSTIVFDAYDSTVDSTLQTSKTQCFGYLTPSFTRSNTYELDVPDHYKHLIFREAMAECHALYKQPNQKAERKARSKRANVRQRRNRVLGKRYNPPVDYSRK